MKRTLRLAGFVMLAASIAIAAYFTIAFGLLMFPANAGHAESAGDASIQAYALSNGVHVDIVLPVRSAQIDWTSVFPLRDFPAPPATPRYVAIGWGDREFYLNTQELSDITASRAVGALFGGHATLVHVYYLSDLDFSTRRYKVSLTPDQYRTLTGYVTQSLVMRNDGSAVAIAGRHYGSLDAFYEARGTYSMFNTCNTWSGTGLRNAGVKMSRWTPLDSMVVWHLEKDGTPGSK